MPGDPKDLRAFLATITLMRDTQSWARWRQIQYGTGFGLFWVLVFTFGYFQFFYQPANCFDGEMNGEERGVDCGGGCLRICSIDVIEPNVRWTQSFKVRDGQYNVVAYVENQNTGAVTPAVDYTVSLYDADGLIAERAGTTPLPADSVYPIFVGPIQTGDRVPTNTFLELADVSEWYPGQSGRGQFTITNQTLAGVDTMPRLTADIYNSDLTEANNVEIVATIFDASGNALTSSRTFVQNFAGRSTENTVFTWPEPIAKTIRSCTVPTNVMVAIDLSGSMNNDQDDPPQPITAVLEAAEAFVDRLRSQDMVALVTFATEAMLEKTFSSDTDQVADSIAGLGIDPAEERGSTNTGDAFVRASEAFASSSDPEARKVMVILTDGLATAPDDEPEEYALARAAELKATGVEVYAIGLGNEVNMEFVRGVATDRNYAYQAINRSQINQIYETITGAICEDGPAVIDIIPKIGVSIPARQ